MTQQFMTLRCLDWEFPKNLNEIKNLADLADYAGFYDNESARLAKSARINYSYEQIISIYH